MFSTVRFRLIGLRVYHVKAPGSCSVTVTH